MTSANFDSDRFSYLLELAYEEVDPTTLGLSSAEKEELTRMRALLDLIDSSWAVSRFESDRVRGLFLQELARKDPTHPWVRRSAVHTLGELVQAGADDIPSLPEATYERLAADPTPVASLLDPQKRTAIVGRALLQASVPQSLLGELLLWLNRTIAELVPRPEPDTQSLLFTRRQRRRGGLR